MLVDTKLGASIVPVIMCGGSGSRLWPLSRIDHPKQFHALDGEDSLFQATVRRLSGSPFARPIILVNQRHHDMTVGQLAEMGVEAGAVVVEPAIRSTGPALAAAALVAATHFADALVLAVPADHIVRDPGKLLEAVAAAIPAASEGRIVTFGIEPEGPETGYGYIARGAGIDGASGVFAVASFIEKPSREKAEQLIAAGGHYWNAGIFLFAPAVMLEELARHAPRVLEAARAALPLAAVGARRIELAADAYESAPNVSIDNAVMERSERVAVVPTAPGWCDVGAWSALWDIGGKDDGGNVVSGDAILRDTRDSYVHAQSGRLVALSGLDDVIVVDTKDAVLVTRRDRAQGVKEIVAELVAAGRDEAVSPKRMERPWGNYESLVLAAGFQVKHIMVKPGGRLSLQFHYHRSEHWTVVGGTAQVTVGDTVSILQPNQSTYIPLGAVHRLENPGKVDLHLIEVQCGDYLGEDDIVRVEDAYGRALAS
jgi:mannose-1-phosphate guanylyltransferase/mannose-1-phosphate guanylyltransferase/mannose-6-phosphate isomerase